MSVGAIGGFDAASFAAASALTRKNSTGGTSAATTASSSADSDFLDYMKMTPGQRMIQNWLTAHKLTQQQLDAMTPKDREAVMKQMQDDIAKQLKDQAQDKAKIDILV